jgi:hypothetical protein
MERYLIFLRQLLFCCLVMAGISLPAITHGQTVTIIGDDEVCVGEVVPYVPDTINAALSYEWTVVPGTSGTVLSGNSTGANIQWSTAGGASVNLVIRDPLNNNQVVFTGSLGVTVYPLPAPFITTDVILGCQPFREDSLRDGYSEPPVFDSTNCQLVCSYSTVTYTANGSSGSTYTWDAYGSISITPTTGPTTNIQWGAPGFGEVVLTETTAAGCVTKTTMCVEIIEKPAAKFVSQPDTDPIVICRMGQVVLNDLSTGSASSPIEKWLWVWGDGHQTTSSAGSFNNPVTHQYDDPGGYEIMLVVTNSCGCTDTFRRNVEVLDPETPKISCPRVVCEGEENIYTIDQVCDDGYWEVDGGTIVYQDPYQVRVRWDNVDPNTGFGYVMYHSCEPCPTIITEEVPVVLRRGVIQGPAAICTNKNYVYRMPKWPTTDFIWSITGVGTLEPTDQRNEISLSTTVPGTILLRVSYFNTVLKCEGSAELYITVLPDGIISGDDLFCQDENQTYTLSGGLSGTWTLRNAVNTIVASSFGNTFNHTFTAAGNYKLSVQGSTFCPPEDFLITVVATPPLPDVILGPDRACPGIPLKYEGGNPLPGMSYVWSVSSGTTNSAVGDHSYITFAGAPNYAVQLRRRTTEGAGCLSDPIQKIILPAVPDFDITGPDTVCHSTEYDFNATYTDGDLYEWYINGATLGSVVANNNSPQPTILFNIPGIAGQWATISVKVTKCGTDHWEYKNVYIRGVNSITAVTLSKDTVCSNETFTLSVYTTADVNSGNYAINWGDGNTSTGTIPGGGSPYTFNYDYDTDGQTAPVTYTPVVTITDPNGCPGTLTYTAPTIVVLPRPIALVSPTGPILHCGTVSQVLTATETTGIGGSNSFTWTGPSFTGGGTSITATDFGFFYATVLNSNGCSNQSNTVQIIDTCNSAGPGNPNGNPSGCGTPPAVTLSVNSSDCGAISISTSLTGGSWMMPTAGTFTNTSIVGNTLTTTAAEAGEFTFMYQVEYSPGCYHIYYLNVLVPYVPETRYGISCNQAGGNYNVTLHDHSTQYPTTPIITRDYYALPGWTYLGSGMSTTFTQAAGTTVTYAEIIQGTALPACTSYVAVTTPAFPTVAISLVSNFNPGCINHEVFKFSRSVTGAVTGYLWDFGDGGTNASSVYNPIGKVYSAIDPSVSVSLTVTDEYGCTATDDVTISVVGNPYLGNVTAAPNPVCQGSPATLTYNAIAGGPLTNYTWYDQSTPLVTTAVPNYNVYVPGAYWVRGTGNFGCKVNTPIAPVDVIQVPAVSIAGNPNQCVDRPFTLRTQDYGPDYEYSWNGGPFGSANTLTTSIATPGGPYNYTVTIRHIPSGCIVNSPVFQVWVSTPPAPPALSYSVLNCNPYELQLTAWGAAGTYNWSNGMSGTTINTYHGGPYQVTLTDIYGCKVQSSFNTPRSPEEYIWIFPTGCFCRETGEPYIIGPIVWFNYWEWQENGSGVLGNSGYVADYWGPSPGNIYNLYLDDGNCQITSGTMYFHTDTCETGIGRPGNSTGLNSITAQVNSLSIAPNPATSNTVLSYSFVTGAKDRSIDIVDMAGRRIRSFVIESNSGAIEMPLSGYSAGTYQVVMRRDGVVVQRGKLSVTR